MKLTEHSVMLIHALCNSGSGLDPAGLCHRCRKESQSSLCNAKF